MHISAKMALVPVVSWLLLVAGLVVPAAAQGTLKQKFGDWQHRCDRPNPAGPEQCILIQNVLDQSDLNLAVVILRVEDSAATAEARRRDPAAPAIRRPVLRVIAPLGILLPRGLGLKIDERDIGSTGFVRCLESGCVAEVDMDNALIDGFKKGKVALFAVFLTPEEGRGLPVTLSGFEQGFAQLQ
ncbi:MAG: invasion associated locus B family protein [Beijerinckiaceae bacterium]|nr:invasion associated locus B family protein [Beijerinckiaceae bacterium]MCZ8298892.1 invasion associated locus B family protein [Beijerinckiaceae bacterium]